MRLEIRGTNKNDVIRAIDDLNKKEIEVEIGELYNKKQSWGSGNYMIDIFCTNEDAEQIQYVRVMKIHG